MWSIGWTKITTTPKRKRMKWNETISRRRVNISILRLSYREQRNYIIEQMRLAMMTMWKHARVCECDLWVSRRFSARFCIAFAHRDSVQLNLWPEWNSECSDCEKWGFIKWTASGTNRISHTLGSSSNGGRECADKKTSKSTERTFAIIIRHNCA